MTPTLEELAHRRGKCRYSKYWTFGSLSHEGRAKRRPAYVTIVEMDEDAYLELDADDAEHAKTLAELWTRPASMGGFGGRSASVQRVFDDGVLSGVIGGVVHYEEPCEWDWPVEAHAA